MRYVETHGKRRWGEKTPLHIWHWEAMARVFPDAVFVAIVRHPGGSMASNMNRWRFTARPRGRALRALHPREMLRCAAKLPEATVMLRYEELLLQPEPVLRELLDWLGEPWSDTVLEHHKVQADRGGREVVEGRNRVSDPLDVSRIAKWTTTINERQQERLQRRIGRLAEFLGYSMTDPAVLEPVNPRGAMLTSGYEIRERFDAFADLDLKTRGPVPRFEHYYHPRDFTLQSVDKPDFGGAPPPPTSSNPLRSAVRSLPLPVRRRLIAARKRLR